MDKPEGDELRMNCLLLEMGGLMLHAVADNVMHDADAELYVTDAKNGYWTVQGRC